MAELSMAEALQKFLASSKLKQSVQALQIEDLWEKMMGKTIAKYTSKIEIVGKTLFITTTVAPLKNELLYQKERIIQLVNENLGANTIEKIVLK